MSDRRRSHRWDLAPAVSVVRKRWFVPRYRADDELSLATSDGVRLGGARLAGPPRARAAVVLVHGFAHSSRNPRIHAFAHRLSARVHVIVPDLRGHGSSEGRCTLGLREPDDVAAAVAAAPEDLPVVTVGISLGGAAVLLHAGSRGGVAGVVAISAPAWSGIPDTPGGRKMQRYVGSRTGRKVLAGVLRTRIAEGCRPVPDSQAVVAGIAPAFTLIVADPADHYFGEEHPRTLYEWAGEPKDLWLLPGSGHGTDLLTSELAERLVDEVERRLSPG